jgi:hypothetical protein
MTTLSRYQRRFAAALLGQPGADPALASHPAIEVHRRTILSGIANALALSFPTIKALTGPEYFEHLTRDFALRHPPRAAVLYDYGGELPAFLETFPGAENYPYFGDVARFDWAIDQTAHRAADEFECGRVLPGFGRVHLPSSMTCVRYDYAVDLIRDAVESGRDDDLRALDVRPSPRWLALWHGPRGTTAQSLSPVAWDILQDLLGGCDAAAILERAKRLCGASRASCALRDEILSSSFARLN